MEVIKTFNQELSSLYQTKPPISKAKITAITRSAIRAIKFYKHVVQSVEKFIIKCKMEYKIPGLYVIDSLVRQSRHQFQGKDVFGPRFARNLKITFMHLFTCPPEDKSKIIRVLNLWQKNEVFTPEVIQPLFDMADPNHAIHKEMAEVMAKSGMEITLKPPTFVKPSTSVVKPSPGPSSKHQEASSSSSKPQQNQELLLHLQHLQSLLQSTGKDSGVKFDKKLLDFDYGEDEGDDEKGSTNAAVDALGSLLSNPEVLRQLQNIQNQSSSFTKVDLESLRLKEAEMAIQEKEFDKVLAATIPKLSLAAVCEFKPEDVSTTTTNNAFSSLFNMQSNNVFSNMDLSIPPPGYPKKDHDERVPYTTQVQPSATTSGQPVVIDLDKDSGSDSNDKSYRKRSRRSRSMSRGRRHRSRSDSRSRSRRKRSRSYDRDRSRDRDREERVERYFDKEKEAERRKKALPPFKKNFLAVCSTTLWIGHLSKLVQEEELSDTFGEYGDVVSINLIPPRGCAFVCMNRRQDAAKALYKLKNTKLQGKTITLAWAPGKGMKDKDWKDFWEVHDGVSYIPYDRLSKEIDYDYLEDGGVFDEDTVPLWLKDHLKLIRKKQEDETQNDTETPTVSSTKGDSGSDIPLPAGYISLPDGSNTSGRESTDKNNSGMVSLPTSGAVVSAAGTANTSTLTGLGHHLLMPPFGLPRLLGPMGMSMGPAGLMSNVPLGVPPPGLPMMHQQLLNRMPPPVNTFNQNLGDFSDGMLPLPFGLQQLQSVNSSLLNVDSDKTGADKNKGLNDQMVNLINSGTNIFNHGAGLPLMSIPPPNMSTTTSTTITNTSIPPPNLKSDKKNDQTNDTSANETDDDDDDVIMEDTEHTFPKKTKEEEKRDNKKDNERDRERDRDKDNRRDRYSDYNRDRYNRDNNDKDSRDDRYNRNGRLNSSRGGGRDDRSPRGSNSRNTRWGNDNDTYDRKKSNDKNNDEKSWNKGSNNNDRDGNSNKNKDDHSIPQFGNLPPSHGPNSLTGSALVRPPPFMRHPGPPPPHMFGPRGGNMEPFRQRFDSPSRNQDKKEDFESGFGSHDRRFPPGSRKDDHLHDNFRPLDNFGSRGPPPPMANFGPRGPPPSGMDNNFGPRGPPPDFALRGPPPPNGFLPRGPFDRPDMPPGFGGPRPLLDMRGSGMVSPLIRPIRPPPMGFPPGPGPFRGPSGPAGQFGAPGPLGFRPMGFRTRLMVHPNQSSPGILGRGPSPLNRDNDDHNKHGSQDFDNNKHMGRKSDWRDDKNRHSDIEPRAKKSRWENNVESSEPGDMDKSIKKTRNESQVTSVTNLDNAEKAETTTTKSINEEKKNISDLKENEIKKQQISPKEEIINTQPAESKSEKILTTNEPLEKKVNETPIVEKSIVESVNEPGEVSEGGNVVTENVVNTRTVLEEVVCDSTVD